MTPYSKWHLYCQLWLQSKDESYLVYKIVGRTVKCELRSKLWNFLHNLLCNSKLKCPLCGPPRTSSLQEAILCKGVWWITLLVFTLAYRSKMTNMSYLIVSFPRKFGNTYLLVTNGERSLPLASRTHSTRSPHNSSWKMLLFLLSARGWFGILVTNFSTKVLIPMRVPTQRI